MKFIYITKPLPVFNKKFRENSGNPSSMFIYKKNGYKEKLRLLYSASFGQKMRSFVSECRLGFNSRGFTTIISHSVLLVYAMLFQSSCNNGYAEVGR